MDDFYNTAERMYNDATILKNNERWFNTCYLCGYIVECYSKIILQNDVGYSYKMLRGYNHNLLDMSNDIVSYLSSLIVGGSVPAIYILDTAKTCPTIINGSESWNPNKRYKNDSSRWGKSAAELYYKEIDEVITLLLDMKINGVI